MQKSDSKRWRYIENILIYLSNVFTGRVWEYFDLLVYIYSKKLRVPFDLLCIYVSLCNKWAWHGWSVIGFRNDLKLYLTGEFPRLIIKSTLMNDATVSILNDHFTPFSHRQKTRAFSLELCVLLNCNSCIGTKFEWTVNWQ